MNVKRPFTCRGVRSRKRLATVLTVAMLLPNAGGPLVPAVYAQSAPVGQGFALNASDLRFIFEQIRIAEAHVALGDAALPGLVGSPRLPYGLRTVDGSFNNLITNPDQHAFGAADRIFPRRAPADFRQAENWAIDPDGPGPLNVGDPTSYTQKKGVVNDSQPRLVSNLIVDQTGSNPAALAAGGEAPEIDPLSGTIFIPNVAPDVGLSAPYNSMFTLFGQFFDHGLDLVTKGGGTVFMPLRADDPLVLGVDGQPGTADDLPANLRFMVLTRATNRPGPDGVLGDDPATPAVDESIDDVQEATNTTTPYVDQNQTYTSHPSHQVFLREYERPNATGPPVATGRLIDGLQFAGNIGNWAEVKAQARTMLGIELSDHDVHNVPLLATDPYGRFIRGANGFPQLVTETGLVACDPSAPVSPDAVGALRTGHAFLDDIAHNAVPNPGLRPDAPTDYPDGIDGTCNFRACRQPAGTYDDELLDLHFVTGDGRGNENIGLTAVHTIFHAEHNRLVANIRDMILGTATQPSVLTSLETQAWQAVNPASGWDFGERLFQAARFVTEMEYQHLVFEEFARKVQPQVNVFSGYHTEIDAAISAEFAHTVYRFGHSMLTETVARLAPNGIDSNDIPLLDAFLNPLAFNEGTMGASEAAGSIVRGMSKQIGNELDEFITEALRNRLLGLPLDLASINMARGRSEGVPRLNDARRQFYSVTGEPALVPYESWADFSLGLRHTDSVVNFIAAYGTHPFITAYDPDGTGPIEAGSLQARRAAAAIFRDGGPDQPADATEFIFSSGAWAPQGGRQITGLDDVDFWVGGLAEKQAPFGGLLGSTFNYIFETQLENLQDGDRFYYLSRTAGLNLLVQLEGNSFAELIMRNTAAQGLPADVFSRPDLVFNLDVILGPNNTLLDDLSTPYNESAMPDLTRNATTGVVRYSGPLHVIWNARNTEDIDQIVSSEGDDTFRGNGGRDIMEGGAGNDQFVGGDGDDVLTDAFGDDVLKGGPGNDYMSSGQGFDLNQGGTGHDFVIGGSDPTETFGGPGNDFIFAGQSADTVFGDDGDDWIEGGGQADLLQGDNGAPFQNDPNQPGHDVIIGDGGDDDYDAEGGDDIMVTGPGIERNEGMLGFDWVTHRGDPQPADADLALTALLPPDVDALRDRFDMVEALSGWMFNDRLYGDSLLDVDMVGHELTAEGIARISGLDAILGGALSFTGGNIILGGAGSDRIEGRGGNDLIDGDRWLNVQLRAEYPNGTVRLVDTMLDLRADVASGLLNPANISIVRSVVTTGVAGTDVDTAVFSGARAEYAVTRNTNGTITVDHNGGIDGVDTLWNIERLQFTDGTIDAPPLGTLVLSTLAPVEDSVLSVSVQDLAASATNLAWAIQAETAAGWTQVAVGNVFVPGDSVVGQRLRAVLTFQADGVPGTITSSPTVAVVGINDPPTGLPLIDDTTPAVGQVLTALTANPATGVALVADADGLGPFSYQWLANNVNIPNATGVTYVPTTAGVTLRVQVSWVDQQGFSNSVVSAATSAVTNAPGGGGTTSAVLTMPTALDFGTRRTGTPVTRRVDISNTGTANLTVTGVTVPVGSPFTVTANTCTAAVAPGRRCRIDVTFTPTAATLYSGAVTVTSNAVNSPTVMNVTGSGR